MNLLAKVITGSTLFGTTVEGSDIDYHSIYLPTPEDCVLNRIRDVWEEAGETDSKVFSLQHLCGMLNEGQPNGIEMVCAPTDKVVLSTPTWTKLHAKRKAFFSKRIGAFAQFSRAMSSKYGLRVDRLNDVERVIKLLEDYNPELSLSTVWPFLPETEHLTKGVSERGPQTDKRIYCVCQRDIQITVPIRFALEVLNGIRKAYGKRVRQAQLDAKDYKSISHAFRACFQCQQIIATGDLTFPVPQAEYLRTIRRGEIPYVEGGLEQKLDDLIAETEAQLAASNLPEMPDPKVTERIILEAYGL